MTIKYPLKKSFVAFLDILGFSERFPKEKDSCIELISTFAKHNGTYFDNKSTDKRKTRVSALAFSDNIAISIPVEINSNSHADEFYVPLMSFLHAISFFSYEALKKGFFIRGAIAYGETHHTSSVIAGESYIEAVKQEKIAHYPRIILAPSATTSMEQLYQQHFYGWSHDKIRNNLYVLNDNIDNTTYFDWLNFLKNYPENNLEENIQHEINNVINTARINLNNNISSTQKIEILKKLNWMENYLNR